MGVFVNFSNHRSENWDSRQRAEAEQFGEIVDIGFPLVNSTWSEEEVDQCAQKYVDQIMAYKPTAVMCQGEFGVAFSVVEKLKKLGVCVLYGCSERCCVETKEEDGSIKRTYTFNFARFRKY